jgi:hypothetical protein
VFWDNTCDHVYEEPARSQVRTRLAAGGNRIRTIGPALYSQSFNAGSSRSCSISHLPDQWFESCSLQRGVTCELDFLDQGAALGYRVPDHEATRPVTVPRSGSSRVTAVANLLMTPIGLALRPPTRLLTSQPHVNRRYHGAYNDQLARNATSR